VRRGEDENPAAGFEHATEFSKRAGVVVEVLEHVERGHDVEVVVREWQLQEVGVVHVFQPSFAAELQRLIRDVDAFRLAQGPQLLEHQACAAPRVEDVEVVTSGIPLTYPVQHDVAPRREPPVGFLGAIEDLVCVQVQPAVFKLNGALPGKSSNC